MQHIQVVLCARDGNVNVASYRHRVLAVLVQNGVQTENIRTEHGRLFSFYDPSSKACYERTCNVQR
jgi:hypothetical protein